MPGPLLKHRAGGKHPKKRRRPRAKVTPQSVNEFARRYRRSSAAGRPSDVAPRRGRWHGGLCGQRV